MDIKDLPALTQPGNTTAFPTGDTITNLGNIITYPQLANALFAVFEAVGLNTEAKTIIGAINEVLESGGQDDRIGTLTSGHYIQGETVGADLTLLDNMAYTIEGQLIAGNTPFFFDYHDGEFGWNPDPERGADTFHPFKKGGTLKRVTVATGLNSNYARTVNVANILPTIYTTLTNNNFFLTNVRVASSGGSEGSVENWLIPSYNASNGVLSIAQDYQKITDSDKWNGHFYVAYDVVCVYVE